MARVLVTGSAQGLGRASAEALLDAGHDVVLHARNAERAAALAGLSGRAAGLVVGDLADAGETRSLAAQVNALGRLDAVIHNAGVYSEHRRTVTADGHARVLAVNVLAPYLLTSLLLRPGRLVFLSSGMHRSGSARLADVDWAARPWNGTQAYCDSKLLLTTLAFAIARRWPSVPSNAVDPGWVPTRMGGPHAPDDLELGHRTQEWLAVSDDPDAMTTGGYWHHQRRQQAAPSAREEDFQERVLDELARLTGTALP